ESVRHHLLAQQHAGSERHEGGRRGRHVRDARDGEHPAWASQSPRRHQHGAVPDELQQECSRADAEDHGDLQGPGVCARPLPAVLFGEGLGRAARREGRRGRRGQARERQRVLGPPR
ncbi:unnamed protein product, partial [Prorocentrum cordatum]